MSDLLIKIRGITKIYKSGGAPVPALRGVTLDISRGEAVAVMGHSGSGKSTLLSIIGGLNPPSEGEILIDGINLYALSQERRADFRREYLGFVFQQFQLIPYLTALENVLLPLTTTRFSVRQKREMASAALQRVGMEGKKERLPNQLSGGEQERVAIARAIVNEPPLLLADEPTGSLDTRTAGEIMALFRSLNECGLTILMVTHNPENTDYMGRTITMQDGLLLNGAAPEGTVPIGGAAACAFVCAEAGGVR
jgi:putative ABC transport system ATP-binding protein